MTDLLVGVDIGTSNLKVGFFDTDGNLVACSQRDCPPTYLPEGRVELDAETWWRAFEGAFEKCLKSTQGAAIRAIGISSQAQSYVLLDGGGKPLGPAVSWLDTRGDAEGTARALSCHGYYAHTGWAEPNEMLAACKLRGQARQPDAWRNAKRLLFADSYVMFRLTGLSATSRNLAAMSGLYSMQTGVWWPEAVECAGVPAELLPRLYETGQTVGLLSSNLARHWRVETAPVVAGANDQTAAALGVGLCRPGEVTLGLGTALVAYQVIEAAAPPHPARLLRGPYAGGLAYQLALSSTAGAAVSWVRDVLAPGIETDSFYAEALAAPPGCDGVRARPDLGDEHGSTGGFFGLTLAHGRGHIFRAVLEGVACVAREKLDLLAAPQLVRVTGGGSANDSWMQMLADVTGRTLERPDQPQAGLWGAALAAGNGAGLFTDILDAARSIRRAAKKFTPSGTHSSTYARVFADCCHLRNV